MKKKSLNKERGKEGGNKIIYIYIYIIFQTRLQ